MANPEPGSPGAWSDLPAEGVRRFDAELSSILKRYPDDRKASAMIPALRIGEHVFHSRLFVGTGKYSTNEQMVAEYRAP